MEVSTGTRSRASKESHQWVGRYGPTAASCGTLSTTSLATTRIMMVAMAPIACSVIVETASPMAPSAAIAAATYNVTNSSRTSPSASEGKRALSVGFFFSLGHSSVVFALAVLLNFGLRDLDSQVRNGGSSLHNLTSIVGTCVSGFFLFLIAAFNLVILAGIIKVFRQMRGGAYDDDALEEQLNKRGLMNRFLGPLARRVDQPWKMYPIGFLFGLGFDTATEIALLVLAGTAVAGGLPFYAILSLPILFAAGMSLFDTADGCFMNFAYDWAFAKPVRKVYYNLTITGLSVFVAVFIGAVELLGLLAQDTSLNGSFWTFLEGFNINTAGLFIVGVFVLTWIVALCVWHFGRIEQKWESTRPLPADTPD